MYLKIAGISMLALSIAATLSGSCKKDRLVITNAGYAIGVIDFYKPDNKSPARIAFGYYVGAKHYSNNYQDKDNQWTVPAKGNYNSGDKYMVQYDKGNPQTARFLFDYPVPDSTTYLKDVTQFASSPPNCCFINFTGIAHTFAIN